MLKVSVLDTSIYGLSTGDNLGLVRWKPWSLTLHPSTKLWQDLGPSKDLIYVYEDVIISNLSSGGSPPFNRSVL